MSIKLKLIVVTLILIISSLIVMGVINFYNAQNELDEVGQEKLINSVNMAISMMDTLNQEVEEGNISENEAQEQIKVKLLGERREDGTRPLNPDIRLGEDGYIFVYNEEGKVLLHPILEGDNIWETQADDGQYFVQHQIEQATENGGGFTRYPWEVPTNPEVTEEKITYSKYYPEWGWIVVAGSYMSDFQAGADNILNTLYWTLGVILLITFLAVYYFSNKIAQGIIKVANYADELASGNLNLPDLKRDHNDEVGILIKSINNMKANLQNNYRKLQSSREELFQQKEELQASYEQLEANNEEIQDLNEELEESIEEANRLNENLERIIKITHDLGRLSLEEGESFLKNVFYTAYDLIPEADYGSVYSYEDGKVNFIETVGHNKEKINELNIPVDYFIEEKEKEVVVIEKINDINTDKINDNKLQKFISASKSIAKTMTFNIIIEGKAIGGISLDIAQNRDENFSENSIYTMRSFRYMIEAFYTFHNYYQLQTRFTREMVLSVTKLLEFHDNYTRGHSSKVAQIASKLAKEMGLSEEEIKSTYWAGLVHDIGKIIIPGSILNKKDKLTAEEFEQIKKHPRWGYETLQNSTELEDIAKYVLHHHERWDGRGYPDGLSQEDIPLISRILTVADAWDAMTSRRSYREALTEKEAKKELIENRAKQFDPKIVDLLITIIETNRPLKIKEGSIAAGGK